MGSFMYILNDIVLYLCIHLYVLLALWNLIILHVLHNQILTTVFR